MFTHIVPDRLELALHMLRSFSLSFRAYKTCTLAPARTETSDTASARCMSNNRRNTVTMRLTQSDSGMLGSGHVSLAE
jgi:hypothetical protein